MKKTENRKFARLLHKIYLFHTQPTLSPTLSTMSARRGPPRYLTSDETEGSESESDGEEEYLEEYLEVNTRVNAMLNDSTWMNGSVAGICTARGTNGTSNHSYNILFDNGKGLKRSIPRQCIIKLPEEKKKKVEIIDLTGETTVSAVSVTSQPSGKQSRISSSGQERATAPVSVTPQNARNGKRKATTTTSTTTASCTAGSSVSTSGPKAKVAKRLTNGELFVLLNRVKVGPIGSFYNTATNKTVSVSLALLSDSKKGREWSKNCLLPLEAQLRSLCATKEMMTGKFKKDTLCSSKRKFDFWKQYGPNGGKPAVRTCWEVKCGDVTVGFCLVNDRVCQCDKNFVFCPDKPEDGKEEMKQGPTARSNIVDLVFFRYDADLVGDEQRCPYLKDLDKSEHKGVMKHALFHIVREILKIQELDGVVACVLVKTSGGKAAPEVYRRRADKLITAAGLQWVKRVRVIGGQVDDRFIALRSWDGMSQPKAR